jgi:hypothetical protein
MNRAARLCLAAAIAAAPVLVLPEVADATTSTGRILRVPSDRTTIGAALAAASNGDTILVSPGVYDENINFGGKAVKLVSTDGPERTIIDGGGRKEVVRISQDEPRGAHLNGFTIRNGRADGFGGGVVVVSASPTIVNNWVVDNAGCGNGIGMNISHTSALIKNNLISRNRFQGCIGGLGIGLSMGGDNHHPVLSGGASHPEVIGNRITDNRPIVPGSATMGGGLSLNSAVDYVVSGNYIADNEAQTAGGLSLSNDTAGSLLVQNVIVGNEAEGDGGGVVVRGIIGRERPTFVANTIADNTAARGSGVVLERFLEGLPFVGNVISSPTGHAVLCRPAEGEGPPVFTKNNVWAGGRASVSRGCSSLSKGVGNISRAPRFVAPGSDYRLRASSPVIDRGAPADSLPARDAARRPRAVDGNGDGLVIPDMGAYEFQK